MEQHNIVMVEDLNLIHSIPLNAFGKEERFPHKFQKNIEEVFSRYLGI